jgi:polyisoprenyl-teichoic acid--peptidoglycan teichoic acid transferase
MNRFEFLKKIKPPKFGRRSIGPIIFWVMTLALAVGIFMFARNFTACWNLTGLPGRMPATCGAGGNPLTGPDLNPDGTPNPLGDAPPTPVVLAPEVALPPAWDGASRINILFIGLDYRDWQLNEGPPRSDTMILFTVDPVTKTAGMLSIPRDLWVNIPGYGYSRINTAYSSGEGDKYPGGGAGLAMKTVEQLLGVPVHYYAQVDFVTFTSLVDKLGCIYVVPEETLMLDPVGSGTDHVLITPGGERKLCGWKVLAYARTRHSEGGDMDRARRQQQVIFALQKKIFDPEVFPSLIVQAPQIYAELSSGIHTNMPLEDAIKLAVLGKDIDPGTIKTGIIDTSMVTFENTILGGQAASVMKPIADKVRVLRDEIFTTSGPLSPIAQGDPVTLMRNEEARVRIVDGTFTPGLDQRAGSFFQAQGMNVTEVGQANEIYNTTNVVVYGPKLYTLKYLQSIIGLSHTQIRFNPDPASTVDIEIRLGSDLAGSIP